ncbi:MAG: zinc metallopeptidase [Spirochaetes bacterium]|nr:zinc metallopeptidase [Spirochaetota bacterium]
MFIDQYYILLVLPTLALSLWAQFKVKSTFAKYSNVPCSKRISGQDAAQLLLKSNKISNVRIESVGGSLTDHYDPRTKIVRLSQPVFNQTSIAAVGVAAHEAGHAIQHATSYGPLALRSTLVPIANIGSSLGPWIAIAGLFFFPGSPLAIVGIALFAGAVLFYLITLPVEFDASARAVAILRSNNVLTEKELDGVKKVLTAAALTYIASALTAVMSLLRLILLSRRN